MREGRDTSKEDGLQPLSADQKYLRPKRKKRRGRGRVSGEGGASRAAASMASQQQHRRVRVGDQGTCRSPPKPSNPELVVDFDRRGRAAQALPLEWGRRRHLVGPDPPPPVDHNRPLGSAAVERPTPCRAWGRGASGCGPP